MPTLPTEYLTLIAVFVPLFSKRIWGCAQVLLIGGIVAPGKRTVTAVLRAPSGRKPMMGLSECRHFQNYHRVLNRAVWSSLRASRVLLKLLVMTFAATGPLVVALDDTIERRRGTHITAKGIYRDPVRSSHSHFVKASGLRWLSLMLLVNLPWAQRVWALPFLTILAPSERYYAKKRRAHKKLTDWARQGLLQLRRWLPQREIVAVADASFAVISLLWQMRQLPQPIWMVVRFRLDAALYEPAPKRKLGQKGRPRLKGKRLPTLAQVLKSRKTQWRRMRVGLRQVGVAYGMAKSAEPLKSPRVLPCGITRVCRSCRSAGCSFETRKVNSNHKRCCVPNWPPSQSRLSNGSCKGGKWK